MKVTSLAARSFPCLNLYDLEGKRGIICVLREVRGKPQVLAIPQRSYREWPGCFSLL